MTAYEQLELDFSDQKTAKPALDSDLSKLKENIIKEVYEIFEQKYSSLYGELEKRDIILKNKDDEIQKLRKEVEFYKPKDPQPRKAEVLIDAAGILGQLTKINNKMNSLDDKISGLYKKPADYSEQRPKQKQKANSNYLNSIYSYKSNISTKIKSSEERLMLEKTTEILSGAYKDEKDGKTAYSWKDREEKLTELLNRYSGTQLSDQGTDSIAELINIVDNNKYLSKNRKEIKTRVIDLLRNSLNDPEKKEANENYKTIEDVVQEPEKKSEKEIREKVRTVQETQQKQKETKAKEYALYNGLNNDKKIKIGQMLVMYDSEIAGYKRKVLDSNDPKDRAELSYYLTLKKLNVEKIIEWYNVDFTTELTRINILREYLNLKENMVHPCAVGQKPDNEYKAKTEAKPELKPVSSPLYVANENKQMPIQQSPIVQISKKEEAKTKKQGLIEKIKSKFKRKK